MHGERKKKRWFLCSWHVQSKPQRVLSCKNSIKKRSTWSKFNKKNRLRSVSFPNQKIFGHSTLISCRHVKNLTFKAVRPYISRLSAPNCKGSWLLSYEASSRRVRIMGWESWRNRLHRIRNQNEVCQQCTTNAGSNNGADFFLLQNADLVWVARRKCVWAREHGMRARGQQWQRHQSIWWWQDGAVRAKRLESQCRLGVILSFCRPVLGGGRRTHAAAQIPPA